MNQQTTHISFLEIGRFLVHIAITTAQAQKQQKI